MVRQGLQDDLAAHPCNGILDTVSVLQAAPGVKRKARDDSKDWRGGGGLTDGAWVPVTAVEDGCHLHSGHASRQWPLRRPSGLRGDHTRGFGDRAHGRLRPRLGEDREPAVRALGLRPGQRVAEGLGAEQDHRQLPRVRLDLGREPPVGMQEPEALILIRTMLSSLSF
jgi:hypothetical protein